MPFRPALNLAKRQIRRCPRKFLSALRQAIPLHRQPRGALSVCGRIYIRAFGGTHDLDAGVALLWAPVRQCCLGYFDLIHYSKQSSMLLGQALTLFSRSDATDMRDVMQSTQTGTEIFLQDNTWTRHPQGSQCSRVRTFTMTKLCSHADVELPEPSSWIRGSNDSRPMNLVATPR